jgi:glycosyltransferase involved in cell wall biosynthesis
VVHVIAPSPAGGAESVVLALASAAKDRTRAVILNQATDPSAPPMPLVDQLRRRGVSVEEIRCGRRRYRAEARALEAHLRDVRASLVHTHGYHGTWVGYYAAKRRGLPLVATVHGYLTRSLKERLYNLVDRRLLRRFDAVIAVSEGIQQQLIRSARRALGVSETERVVGWVGRLSPEKGADLLLQALAATDAEVKAVIIGEGPEHPRLVEMIRTLELDRQDRVRLAGYRSDAAELLSAFDVLALTSRMEGTPMIVLEAVAAGLPIIAFAVGGIPKLLTTETAWLVTPEDPQAFAAALREAVRFPDEAKARAARARASLAERLSIERWLERIRDVYRIVRQDT